MAEEKDPRVKPHLMHSDRDFDLQQPLPWNESALMQDLELETLLQAMARNDKLIREVAHRALLAGWGNDPDTVHYRQAIMQDGLRNPAILRSLYALTLEVAEKRRSIYWFGSRLPASMLYGAIEKMQVFVRSLRRLRDIGRTHVGRFASEGFIALFSMLERELTDSYFAQIEAHLHELKFRNGVLISAELGTGNAGRNHILSQPRKDARHWLRRLFDKRPPGYTFHLPARDDAGARALSELRDRGIRPVAEALSGAAEHIDQFFQTLRAELAFYVGCLNLHEQLVALGAPMCFPRPLPADSRRSCFQGLYDPCLALTMGRRVVGNTVDTKGKSLIIVTGANQGGKSSFLRGMGLAQLMMQGGMFVAAEVYEGALCTALFTHYKREEDSTLESGKFDEELARLSGIVDHLKPNAMVLFNESFASTNVREGSEIAQQVVSTLLERSIRICFVTHLHRFAHDLFIHSTAPALFLRAERLPNGTRTFLMVEGEPLTTSYGKDVYEKIFAAGA